MKQHTIRSVALVPQNDAGFPASLRKIPTALWVDLLLLLFVAAAINAEIGPIKSVALDDLTTFSMYHSGSFWDYVWNTVAFKIRPVSYFFVGLGFFLTDGGGYDLFIYLLALNYIAAVILYAIAKKISQNRYVALVIGVLYLLSRFAYYQVYQVLGAMECSGLVMAVFSLWYIYRSIAETDKQSKNLIFSGIFSLLAIYSHERYLCLLVVLLAAILMRLPKAGKTKAIWIGSAVALLLGSIAVRFVLFDVPLAGTGGTNMTSSIDLLQILFFFFSGLVSLLGFNAGPEFLFGLQANTVLIKFPFFFVLSVIFAIGLLFLLFSALCRTIRCPDRAKRAQQLKIMLVFALFIAGTLATSCTTIRMEMRWLYAPYAGLLLFLAYSVRILFEKRETSKVLPGTEENGRRRVRACLAIMLLVAVPFELFYRVHYHNMYFFPAKTTFDQLYELSIEKYGTAIYNRPIVFIESGKDAIASQEVLENYFYQYSLELFADENRPIVPCYYVTDIKGIPPDVLSQSPYVFQVVLNYRLYPSINMIPTVSEVSPEELEEAKLGNLGTNIRDGVLRELFYGWEGDGEYIHMSQVGSVEIRTGREQTLELKAVVQEMNLPNVLRIYFNDTLIAEESVSDSDLSLTISSEQIPVEIEGTVKLELERATSDKVANGGADVRIIGMTIYDLQFN